MHTHTSCDSAVEPYKVARTIEIHWVTFEHSPYIKNASLSNYHILVPVKEKLKQRHFDDDV